MITILLTIICLFWFSAATSIIGNIGPFTNKLNIWKQIIIIITIFIGTPFMLVTQAIELILDIFLEEGWNDDDNFKH